MDKINAVIFDMDGLMFDTEMIYYRSSQETADEMGLPYSKEYYFSLLGRSDKETKEIYLRDFKDAQVVEEFVAKSYENFNRICQIEGVPVKKGLHHLLTYLQEEKMTKIVASSNNRAAVESFLKQAHIYDLFENIISGEEVAHAKPHPAIFEAAFVMTGEKNKQNVVILEDSPSGIQAAFSAAIPCIMVPDMFAPTDKTREQTIAVLEDLDEVKEFIENTRK